MKSFFVAIIGGISFLYLINPTAGIVELIPDITPVVGNLDEATAMALVLSSLAYFGIDLGHLFKRDVKKEAQHIKEAEYDENNTK